MRNRINGMRQQLVDALPPRACRATIRSWLSSEGCSPFPGLTKDQVEQLREQYAIYIVGSGRINVAGLTPANIDRVAEAIGVVVG